MTHDLKGCPPQTLLSITYEHIQEARYSWSCYENVNDGISIRRTWIHGDSPTYEASIAAVRDTRTVYELPLFKGVQTIHISRSLKECQ